MHLVNFCYYTVVDKNCIQASAKFCAPMQLITYVLCKYFPTSE